MTTIASIPGILPLTTPLLNIPHVDLAHWMGNFVLEVCKKDGSTRPNLCMLCRFKHVFEENGIHNVNPLNIGILGSAIFEQL